MNPRGCEEAMPNRKIPPVHPGELLLEEFLDPSGSASIASQRT